MKPMFKKSLFSRRWVKVCLVIFAIMVIVGGIVIFRAESTLFKITGSTGILRTLVQALPGVEDKLLGEEEGRINILILGMRGEKMEGGGLLADVIIVASIKPAENKKAMVSIPRDLWVKVPNTEDYQKINAVHYYGEERGGNGLNYMKQVVSEVTGQPIHYAVRIDFEGFRRIVDALGGVSVVRESEFVEPVQFHEERVCDPNVFTVSSGNVQKKIDDRGKIVAQYPMCYNANEECGGVFRVPKGETTLSGAQALCYVRARATSSDFDRARRQHEVISALLKKGTTIGVLTDYGKINEILNAVGDGVRTDLKGWEMKRAFDLYQQSQNIATTADRVLENSQEGLLYQPEEAMTDGRGYILLPRAGNYSEIHALFAGIP